MPDGKIQFQLGRLAFTGEGSEEWVAGQLVYLLSKVPELTSVPDVANGSEQPDAENGAPKKPVQVGSLASHIKAKGGETNQVMRFLATADWLRLKGESNLKTALVSKALQENHQKKLANAADCLGKNVTKGLCEKHGDSFYITPEGLKVLGHE